jgi:hypothetical protein
MIKIGDVFKTNKSGNCTVMEYIDYNNVKIRFKDGTEKICNAGALRNGQVKNLNHPIIYGIAFIGVGNYSCKLYPRIYNCWIQMLRRCYNETIRGVWPTYSACTVCERWWNFQNFAPDYLSMFGSALFWQIDKDLRIKGNKLYSPETCCLVPPQINTVLEKSDASRGEFRIGVSPSGSKTNPYKAACNVEGKLKYLGSYKTEEEARLAYKAAKEAEFKRLGNLFKDDLDPEIYTILMNRVVDIDD